MHNILVKYYFIIFNNIDAYVHLFYLLNRLINNNLSVILNIQEKSHMNMK